MLQQGAKNQGAGDDGNSNKVGPHPSKIASCFLLLVCLTLSPYGSNTVMKI